MIDPIDHNRPLPPDVLADARHDTVHCGPSILKPCPFCYGEAHIADRGSTTCVACIDDEGWVKCAEWNTRPIEDDLRARVAKLEGALRFYADDGTWFQAFGPDGEPIGCEAYGDSGQRAREALEVGGNDA